MRWLAFLLGSLLATLVPVALVSQPALATYGGRLYVAPGTANPSNTGCGAAGFNTIQSAVNVAHPDSVVIVCPGVYAEQIAITTPKITIRGMKSAIIRPIAMSQNATDEDSGTPIYSIIDVKPGAHSVRLIGLTVDGSAAGPSLNACSEDFIGVLYQASPGSSNRVSGTLHRITVENIKATNAGCGGNLAVLVQSGPSGTSSAGLRVTASNISGYGKNGVTCSDIGTTCTLLDNTITTSPTSVVAQNGVQIGFGAIAKLEKNIIVGDNWTAYGTDSNPQVQSDFGAGVLLYAAGVNTAGVTTRSSLVKNNQLTDDQIGVEVVDSQASVRHNSFTETSGIAESVGVYGVGCDAYCNDFTDANSQPLNTVASNSQNVAVISNTINFSSAPSGSVGIWLGDDSWTGGSGYAGPSGRETVTLVGNSISNVGTPTLIGGGA
jgi:hypothetical protein